MLGIALEPLGSAVNRLTGFYAGMESHFQWRDSCSGPKDGVKDDG
jgi:hypothetical protein